MISTLKILLELAVIAGLGFLLYRLIWRRWSRGGRILMLVLCFCAMCVSASVSAPYLPVREVTITALAERNSDSQENTIYLRGFKVNGAAVDLPEPAAGSWTRDGSWYKWFDAADERREPGTTDSITFTFAATDKVELAFLGNRWKGMAAVEAEGKTITVDTYSGAEENVDIPVTLPQTASAAAVRAILRYATVFAASFLVLCLAATALAALILRLTARLTGRAGKRGAVQKLLSYQFLFEELVKRDFKKKYKRTVLGMAWSVLSPLLMLLVMRLVFTQFFGRNTPHYTTYLFCGNLVFSFFNESSTQGMSSLMSNAGIFSKVNVPKYLFLFSKNTQTLINFGLTLCVFFVFCIIDHITFTWRFVCLLYPITMLVLFNIGVGLVLSALFVFFRDIQYLWSVFTQLLMYMSAIFYTIDRYSPTVQNLFLLNPIYLFIRYFRKIVIEATIPTPWFHLLMLADVLIVLGLGCWMYKKYNHRFLYYV